MHKFISKTLAGAVAVALLPVAMLSCQTTDSKPEELTASSSGIETLARHPSTSQLKRGNRTLYVVGEIHSDPDASTLRNALLEQAKTDKSLAVGAEGLTPEELTMVKSESTASLGQMFAIEEPESAARAAFAIAIQGLGHIALDFDDNKVISLPVAEDVKEAVTTNRSYHYWRGYHMEFLQKLTVAPSSRALVLGLKIPKSDPEVTRIQQAVAGHLNTEHTRYSDSIRRAFALTQTFHTRQDFAALKRWYKLICQSLARDSHVAPTYRDQFAKLNNNFYLPVMPLIVARDTYFASSIQDYIQQHPVNTVVLIVGRSHRAGVVDALTTTYAWTKVVDNYEADIKDLREGRGETQKYLATLAKHKDAAEGLKAHIIETDQTITLLSARKL